MKTRMSLVGRRRLGRSARVRLVAASAVIVVALVVAICTAGVAYVDRPSRGADERSAVQNAATTAVRAVMTLNADGSQPPDVAAHLTDPVATRHLVEGPDMVLPRAHELGVAVRVQVVGTAVHDLTPTSAQVLVFADQTVTAAGNGAAAPSTQRTPVVRWVSMRKVGATWLMSDLRTAGDVTR